MKKSAYPSAYMTSYAYLLSSGIILMPVIFIAAFLRPSWFKKKDSIVLLTQCFIIVLSFYSAVFKKEILHYYYYGRYIVPYIAVIVVLGAYILSRTAESMAHIRILRDEIRYALCSGGACGGSSSDSVCGDCSERSGSDPATVGKFLQSLQKP